VRVGSCLFLLAAAVSSYGATAGIAHAEQGLSTSGRVLVGPRLARGGDVLVAGWIEDPKTLVVTWLDASGAATDRQSIPLPEEDATIVDLAPVVRSDGSLSIFLLERGVTRIGSEVPLRRIIVRHVTATTAKPGKEERPLVQVVAEAPDDGSGRAPAAIVGAGLYTVSRWPAVLWRRGGDGERSEANTELAIVRPEEVTSSEILGDSRFATAVAWRDDGGALVAASDAGRPVVIETAIESQIDVPTPAALTGLAMGSEGDWFAAGVDAGRRLFVVARAAQRAAQTYFQAVAPLVDAPADLADVGAIVGAPRLVRVGALTALLWPARIGKTDAVRVRALDGDGRAARASSPALSCKKGERALGLDAAELGGSVIVVALCASDSRADVRSAIVPASYFGSLFPL
jgi:hypothetical protein